MSVVKKCSDPIVIVGAGPAGLACAIELKRLGEENVLVLDKCSFPRYKCCAGYVTGRTAETYMDLGADPLGVGYSLIRDFRINYLYNQRLVIDNRFLYASRSVSRTELDYSLFLAAKRQGVEIMENANVTGYDVESSCVLLSSGESVRFSRLVLADGAAGIGFCGSGIKRRNIALQLHLKTDKEDGIAIHFGVSRRGYGWVSVSCGSMGIGLTDVYDPNVNYRELFANYLKNLGVSADLSGLRAAFTPIGVGKAISGGSVYRVGDALGACDPLTLSGLRYGLQSGCEAARAIYNNKPRGYETYASRLRLRFSIMSLMQKAFYMKAVQGLVFGPVTSHFGGLVSAVFNGFFVNKK